MAAEGRRNTTYDVPGGVPCFRAHIGKPVLDRYACLAEVILADNVLIPDDQFYDAQLVRDTEVDWKVPRRVLGRVLRINSFLGHWRVVSSVE